MTTREPGARLVLTHGCDSRPRSTALRASRPAATITDGLEVLVHDVMAAMTTAPWSISTSASSTAVDAMPPSGTRSLPRRRAGLGSRGYASWKEPAAAESDDAVLRAARPGQARLDGVEVEHEPLAEVRDLVAVLAEHALRARVRLDQGGDVAAAGRLQVAQRAGVDGKRGGGGAVLRRHVGERRAVRHRQRGQAVAAELDELADDAVARAASRSASARGRSR